MAYDDIFGDIDEHEIVETEEESVSNLIHFGAAINSRYADLFGKPYESDAELEADAAKAQDASIAIYIQSAVRRRAIGACYYRHNAKNSKYKTLEELGKNRFNLGRWTFRNIAENAAIEMYLAKMCEISHILQLNLRDSFFTMLNKYPEVHHVAIVNEMAKRKIPMKGKPLSDFCQELGIEKKDGTTRTAHTPIVNREPTKPTQLAIVFSDEQSTTNFKAANGYNLVTGNRMSQEEFALFCYKTGLRFIMAKSQ